MYLKKRFFVLAFVISYLAMATPAFSKVEFKFNGDLFYILRYDHFNATTSGVDTKQGDVSHNYFWSLKAKAIVTEHLMMGVRVSNPAGFGSNKITDNFATFGKSTHTNSNYIIAIPELYFKWTPGIASLMAGNIPVIGNVPLDFVAWEPTGYKNLGKCGWNAVMNNSLSGMDLTFDLVKNKSTKVGLKTVWAVGSENGKSDPSDLFKSDQHRVFVSAPMSFAEKKLSLIPLIHFRANVYRAGDASNNSFSGGLDVAIKANKTTTIKTGFAAGGYKNDCMVDDTAYSANSPYGVLAVIGGVVKPKFGKIMLDVKYSSWENREGGPKSSSIHSDFKIAIPVKKLTLMPRFRMWTYFNDDNDNTSTHLRPELFFISKF